MPEKEKGKTKKKVKMAAWFWASAHVNGFLVLDCSRRAFLYNAMRQSFISFVRTLHPDCDKSTEDLLVNLSDRVVSGLDFNCSTKKKNV